MKEPAVPVRPFHHGRNRETAVHELISLQDGPMRNCQVAQDRRRTHCVEQSRERPRGIVPGGTTPAQVAGRFKADKQIFADAGRVMGIKPE